VTSIERQRLQELKQLHQESRRRHTEAASEASDAAQAINGHKRTYRNMQERVQRAETRVEEIQDAIEALVPQAGLLEQLERDLENAEEEKAMHTRQFEDSVTAIDEANRQNREVKNQLDELESQLRERDQEIRDEEEGSGELVMIRQRALSAKNVADQAVQEGQRAKSRADGRVEDARAKVEELTENVIERGFGNRVPVDWNQSLEALEKRIKKLIEDINTASAK
jgi:chromosome segregation ATPase